MAAFSGLPPANQAVPPPVRRLAAGRPLRPVWRNEVGGLTFQIGVGANRSFVKWAPAGSGLDLDGEAARLGWAARFTPVPRLLDQGADDDGAWLLTAGLPGENAVSERWKADPGTAAAVIGQGLRRLHDVLPVADCPFSWSARSRLSAARRLAAAGEREPDGWHPDHAALGRDGAWVRLVEIPEVDRLVVCHGDACAPNTLINNDGTWAGHVDLGALGRADRWADLAVATWSLDWNYGPGWQNVLLDAYGVAPDLVRIGYYRLLRDFGP